ncbi:membrane protein [Legionella busanensis]|uniref:Membrane protein n=1 Tax=Legionella busanensis TaxID=190655 RepID=A0A378JJQ5_9GAMM|nr:TIGR03752 family integrating conjugative element protein [Legionella busanensis]STX50928.1 membrane protein [Legionella busanensis]
MTKNLGLKVLTGSVVGVTALIFFNSSHHTVTSTHEPIANPNNFNEAIASQFNDNIRDVAARLQETEQKLLSLEAEHQATNNKSSENQASLDTNLLEELNTLKEQILSIKPTHGSESTTYSIENTQDLKPSPSAGIKDIDQILIKQESNQAELAYWERLKAKRQTTTKKTTLSKKKSEKTTIPYYTIPAGSDLGHTTLLSALIGEVPVEGKLMQPLFPFSAIINRGDLIAANGIALPPTISGMKVNGYAIGVGSFLDNISCVRAYVTSALFVFTDGHFVTVGKEKMTGTAELVNNESLGYLTTAFGNPCIKGQYFTNAPQFLTTMVASDSIKGFGNALSQWQMSYNANINGTTSIPTGSLGNYALGGALSQGTIKGAEWLEKRIQGSFDMVFVPASFLTPSGYKPTQLSLHITQTIHLDKDVNGRVLDYGQSQKTLHDFSLR